MPEKMSDVKSKNKRYMSSTEDSFSSSSSSTSSSSDEETSATDLKPIKEYLSNRTELASQLFKSVKPEKIRMMLPQTLKKADLRELEEWCAAELIGMSKKRIISIIDDHPMLESSDTDESDNSGPSLEIISDTEWISEDSTSVKIEGSKSKNKQSKKVKKKPQDTKDKPALKSKGKGKTESDGKSNVKIKTEKIKTEGKPKEKQKEKDKEKDKEGGSLLDLLELEMRARAIRALIRKEEDSSNPKDAKSKTSSTPTAESGSTNNTTSQTRQANLKEQLEKIDVLMKHGDDEDVFVVVHPAPTIELLSSDSENEDPSKRVNKKLVSERTTEKENTKEKEQTDKNKIEDKSNEKVANQEKDKLSKENTNKENTVKEKNDGTKNKKLDNQKESPNLPISVIESSSDDKPENPSEELEEGEIVDDAEDEKRTKEPIQNTNEDVVFKKKIKVRKNPHVRSRKRTNENSDEEVEKQPLEKNAVDDKSEKIEKKMTEKTTETPSVEEKPIEIEESPPRNNEKDESSSSKKTDTKIDYLDDKALDIEEIINLDDYPDDYDLENNQSSSVENKTTDENTSEATANSALPRSETWATRYIKQDDVQSVIKESKIQSEIRKRLRERQRQNKINNSPNLNSQETSEPSPEHVILKPTGSVEEYLALKALSSGNGSNISRENADSPNLQLNMQSDSLSSNSSATDKELLPSSDNKEKSHAKDDNEKLVLDSVNKSDSQEDLIEKTIKACLEKNDASNKDKVRVIELTVDLSDIKLPLERENKSTEQSENINTSDPCKQSEVDKSVTLVEKINVEVVEKINVDRANDQIVNVSPSKDDVNSVKSDSSEDNVTVNIDKMYASNAKPMPQLTQTNVEKSE